MYRLRAMFVKYLLIQLVKLLFNSSRLVHWRRPDSLLYQSKLRSWDNSEHSLRINVTCRTSLWLNALLMRLRIILDILRSTTLYFPSFIFCTMAFQDYLLKAGILGRMKTWPLFWYFHGMQIAARMMSYLRITSFPSTVLSQPSSICYLWLQQSLTTRIELERHSTP